ncbi:MAG: ATP-binding cassette domain-containing protein [Bacteroidales bacterium]|nr:ATP-binding cassette domain-containing protein [Bacteroidales bacterium]
MNESILRALMRLFAIVANVNKDNVSSDAREIVKTYLSLQLNNTLVQEYLALFDEYISVHHKKATDGSKKERKRTALNSVKVLMICHEINEQLEQKEKIIVLIRLLEFIHEDFEVTEKELDFVKTVAETFNISEEEYYDLKYYIIDGIEHIKTKKKVLLIDSKSELTKEKELHDQEDRFIHQTDSHLNGEIAILHIASTNTYILKYCGEDSLYLNSQNIIPKRAYVFENGSVIKGKRISPVYYTDVAGRYIHDDGSAKIVFTARDIEFRFKNSTNGIQKFSFSEESGNLVGIMGGSGVGKSTLLNVLNGNLPLNSGSITINGYDLYADKEMLEGVIGFVPQDDLLIEELSVFQNLYYNAKLCFSNFNEEAIERVVEQILLDLDLIEIKDLKVGDPLNKFISGGQRKRLNIALELMREPSVLIVDEPTSGLSSQDSEIVMSLLKEQTLKGKLVIVNIHQPSSDIYKLFDRLLILDKGGYPAYYGNPIDAVVYFKTASKHVNASESECGVCGNVNPEQSLQILEAKIVNEYGRFTRERKITPKEWYNQFLEKIHQNIKIPETTEKLPLPKNMFKIPGRFRQFKIFSIRNLLSKLTNKQYLLINFLEAPLLAVILGYFTKYISGSTDNPNQYLFSENENIPAYLFMAVIVALFIGLTVSAEEIIRDRKILKRESFLNLSWASYLNSKIVVLFAMAAIQAISFILVGNFILGIKWMTFSYFIIIFSTIAAANLIGLNISSALNSVVTIYITIPFILVPQLLFSGVIVSFNKLHQNFMSVEYVPIIGDLMISRWAYEALAVNQFKNNEYEKHFFELEKEISHYSFQSMFRLPELQSRVDRCIKSVKKDSINEQFKDDLLLIKNEFNTLSEQVPDFRFEAMDQLSPEKFSPETGAGANNYIDELSSYYRNKVYQTNNKKDEVFNALVKKLGDVEAVAKLKEDYYNKRLAESVLNKNEVKKIVETDHHTLFQVKDPIFKQPETNYGRAHFYAAEKIMFGKSVNTIWFNLAIIWLSVILLYVLLLYNGLKKAVDFLSELNFVPKLEKK